MRWSSEEASLPQAGAGSGEAYPAVTRPLKIFAAAAGIYKSKQNTINNQDICEKQRTEPQNRLAPLSHEVRKQRRPEKSDDRTKVRLPDPRPWNRKKRIEISRCRARPLLPSCLSQELSAWALTAKDNLIASDNFISVSLARLSLT